MNIPDNKDQKYYVHPTSIVEEGAEVGDNTKIWHFSHVRKGAKVGSYCILGHNVYVDPDTIIGNYVKIQNNVSVYAKVTIEDFVFLGPSMVFTNVINPRSHIERKTEFRSTLVRRGATIGANATVLCGLEIGEFAFIGAGAVVRTDVPAFGLILGVPGRLQGWMCQCGRRLHFMEDTTETTCRYCHAEYYSPDPMLRIELIKPPAEESLPFKNFYDI